MLILCAWLCFYEWIGDDKRKTISISHWINTRRFHSQTRGCIQKCTLISGGSKTESKTTSLWFVQWFRVKVRKLDDGNRSHLKPQAETVPLASVDGAVKRCRLPGVDLHPLYSQEVRRVHYKGMNKSQWVTTRWVLILEKKWIFRQNCGCFFCFTATPFETL